MTWNNPTQEEVNKMVEIALDGGINWFDTAEVYGWGGSERALSKALGKASFFYLNVLDRLSFS
jgi:aryl-alcohol dehydrogenase-like predicted oxidoreductase